MTTSTPSKPTEQQLIDHDMAVHKHIQEMRQNMMVLMQELAERAKHHDESKFSPEERDIYAATFHRLAQVVYDSPEYHQLLADCKPAIDHHWANNRHHPEHWPDGINDMDLVDLLEMLADWVGASKRNKNGNIHKSIEVNTTRHKISPQLVQILTNTVERYF